jgi:hypothetical protein
VAASNGRQLTVYLPHQYILVLIVIYAHEGNMTEELPPAPIQPSYAKQTSLTLTMSTPDAEKMLSLFASGALKELGVIDVIVDPPSAEPGLKQWAETEKDRQNPSKHR